MRPHLPDDELHAYCDGELSPSQRAEVSQHLLACIICRASHAEVLALRLRTSELLAIAAPRMATARQPVRATPLTPVLGLPQTTRVRARASLLAAGLATLLAGGWYLTQPAPTNAPLPRFARAFLSTGLFSAPASSPVTVPGVNSGFIDRALAIGSRVNERPRIVVPSSPALLPTVPVFQTMDPIDADPAPGWKQVDLATATSVAQGALPLIETLPLNSIRMHPSAAGARPTFLARFLLPNGHSLWLTEGAEEELESVQNLLASNGLNLSISQRTRPDYITVGDATRRTVRMVLLAADLPVDSLNALIAKVKLK